MECRAASLWVLSFLSRHSRRFVQIATFPYPLLQNNPQENSCEYFSQSFFTTHPDPWWRKLIPARQCHLRDITLRKKTTCAELIDNGHRMSSPMLSIKRSAISCCLWYTTTLPLTLKHFRDISVDLCKIATFAYSLLYNKPLGITFNDQWRI